jgi:L-asparagine oxygenase
VVKYEKVAIHTLTNDIRESVRELARSDISLSLVDSLKRWKNGGSPLPNGITAWRDKTRLKKIGLLRNLPIDTPLQPTPFIRRERTDPTMLADVIIGMIASLFGSLYTIEGKLESRLIHDIFPICGDEFTQLGTSSLVELDWHVEEAFHPSRPSWLLLLCLRGDPGVRTRVARVMDFRFSDQQLRLLRCSNCTLRVDETYSSQGSDAEFVVPLLSGDPRDPQIILDPAYTVFKSDSEVAAVELVKRAAEKTHTALNLSAGDCLVFDNRRTIHARTAFMPHLDGTDRWLKRAYALDEQDVDIQIRNGVLPFKRQMEYPTL